MQIGQYEILDVIGDGGMGTVYRARDPRFDRIVAVKVLHEHFRRDPEVSARFRTEAVIQAKLSHPHIVSVYDFVADESTLAFVMEYLEGIPLDALLAREGNGLTVPRAVHLTLQVLRAVDYAHRQGLVHRDIKPSNIMVEELSGEDFVKVMDFGVAKVVGAEKLRTATSAKIGTLAYMPPEQIVSPKGVDHRADIYSIAATLYEMLSGEVPFGGDTEYELMRQIVEQGPAPLPVRIVACAPALDSAIRRAMARRPEDRFESCGEFVGALQLGAPVGAARALPTPLPSAPSLPRSGSAPSGRVPVSDTTSASPSWRIPLLASVAAIGIAGLSHLLGHRYVHWYTPWWLVALGVMWRAAAVAGWIMALSQGLLNSPHALLNAPGSQPRVRNEVRTRIFVLVGQCCVLVLVYPWLWEGLNVVHRAASSRAVTLAVIAGWNASLAVLLAAPLFAAGARGRRSWLSAALVFLSLPLFIGFAGFRSTMTWQTLAMAGAIIAASAGFRWRSGPATGLGVVLGVIGGCLTGVIYLALGKHNGLSLHLATGIGNIPVFRLVPLLTKTTLAWMVTLAPLSLAGIGTALYGSRTENMTLEEWRLRHEQRSPRG